MQVDLIRYDGHQVFFYQLRVYLFARRLSGRLLPLIQSRSASVCVLDWLFDKKSCACELCCQALDA